MNARFWISCHGSSVKLTLRPGQVLEFTEGGPHDEGFSYTHERFEFDGDVLTSQTSTRSRDCDGPHESYGDYVCPVHKLKAHVPCREYRTWVDGELVRFPDWERVSAHQRDHYAEAMGY